jgi:hypothetical protein
MSFADIERVLKANRVIEALPTPDQVPETRGHGGAFPLPPGPRPYPQTSLYFP